MFENDSIDNYVGSHNVETKKPYYEPDSSAPDIVVNINSHNKISTYMETYIAYNIDTSSSKGSFSVTRRYGDFEWLSLVLGERYPMAIIPPLPQKHSVATIERFVGNFIEKRQSALCRFLRRLLCHPIVGLDSDCWLFLSSSAFSEQRRTRPAQGKLEGMMQSLSSLTSGAGVSNGGCVDSLYKSELSKALDHTCNISAMLKGLERVVCRSIDSWVGIGHVAEAAGPSLQSWTMLADIGAQYGATGEALRERLEPWVCEYGLYCVQAERAARRRQSVEGRFAAGQSRVTQGRPDSARTLNQLQDTLSRSNADLKSEFDRWQSQRTFETKDWLSRFADVHVEHYQRTAEIWRQCMATVRLSEEDYR